jgi:hypothetical protein
MAEMFRALWTGVFAATPRSIFGVRSTVNSLKL